MKRKHLRFGRGFRVAIGNQRSQAAQMTLAVGETEGAADNRHRGADQWLYVLAGAGEAIINRKRYPLSSGTLLLIERGDLHEIKNKRSTPLQTMHIYVPPAYASDGEDLPARKSH